MKLASVVAIILMWVLSVYAAFHGQPYMLVVAWMGTMVVVGLAWRPFET